MFDVVNLVLSELQTLALFITFLIMAYVAIRQLRAYVYPRVNGIKHFSLSEPIEITVVLKNAGQTPAKDCETTGVVFVGTLRRKFNNARAGQSPTQQERNLSAGRTDFRLRVH